MLLAAARDVTHLGGHKGRGLGWCRIEIGATSVPGEPATWQALVEQVLCDD